MPSNIVMMLIERVAKIEARIESLMTWQKWQMGLLAAIFIVAVKAWVR